MITKILMDIHNNLPEDYKKTFVLNSNKIRKFLKILRNLIILLLIILAALYISKKSKRKTAPNNKIEIEISDSQAGVEAALINYKDEVLKYSQKYELPPEYIMALIMLESSGRRVIKPRFEKWVYNELKKLRNNKLEKFEHLTPETVKNADNEALKNLARSWGPCQIMGYKCVSLGITISDLRGEDRIKWALKWINTDYGNYLRAGKYKDAFHIHNTGQAYPKTGKPKTYDPDYVKNGLDYMEYFKKELEVVRVEEVIRVEGGGS